MDLQKDNQKKLGQEVGKINGKKTGLSTSFFCQSFYIGRSRLLSFFSTNITLFLQADSYQI